MYPFKIKSLSKTKNLRGQKVVLSHFCKSLSCLAYWRQLDASVCSGSQGTVLTHWWLQNCTTPLQQRDRKMANNHGVLQKSFRLCRSSEKDSPARVSQQHVRTVAAKLQREKERQNNWDRQEGRCGASRLLAQHPRGWSCWVGFRVSLGYIRRTLFSKHKITSKTNSKGKGATIIYLHKQCMNSCSFYFFETGSCGTLAGLKFAT